MASLGLALRVLALPLALAFGAYHLLTGATWGRFFLLAGLCGLALTCLAYAMRWIGSVASAACTHLAHKLDPL